MSLVNHLIFVTFFFLITSPFEDFVDHPQSAEPSPNNCTDLWELTSSGDKNCTGCIVFFHIIIGLLEQLTKEKRAHLSVAHLKSVVFKLANPYPEGTRRLSWGNLHRNETDPQQLYYSLLNSSAGQGACIQYS